MDFYGSGPWKLHQRNLSTPVVLVVVVCLVSRGLEQFWINRHLFPGLPGNALDFIIIYSAVLVLCFGHEDTDARIFSSRRSSRFEGLGPWSLGLRV